MKIFFIFKDEKINTLVKIHMHYWKSHALPVLYFAQFSVKITDPVLQCSKDRKKKKKKSQHHMTGLAVCFSVEQGYFLRQNVTTVLSQIENSLSYRKKINPNCILKYFISTALMPKQSLHKIKILEIGESR